MMIIKYETSVFTPAGWRGETVTAEAEKISDKRARITEILDIGGNGNHGYHSRTGAKRQMYNVGGVAKREIDKIKILSKCEVVEQ